MNEEQLTRYKRTARARHRWEQRQRQARQDHAWKAARQAAALLKREFGAQQVVVFGSLIHPRRFTRWSDVDLAAWGLTARNWLQASAAVRALSDEIEMNLVDVACCPADLQAVIEREGVPL